MIVYHGSLFDIPTPDVQHSKSYVDFGKAFYVTTFYQQALRWAKRKADRAGLKSDAFVNKYELDEDKLHSLKVLKFDDSDSEWLDFVCSCRKGIDVYSPWDVVIGPVADDDVFKTVNKYFKGDASREETLNNLRYQKKSDQIAFISNVAIVECLKYLGNEVVKGDGV